MSRRLRILLLMLCWLPAAAPAFFPPDAEYRQQEILEYRRRKKAQYAEANRRHEKQMIVQDSRVRSRLATPFWMRGSVQTGVVRGPQSPREQAAAQSAQRNNRLLVSILLIVLIGIAVLWVRHATRRMDEQDETSWH